MSNCLILLASLLACAGIVRAETLEQALGRFLAGETITAEEVAGITDMRWPQPAWGGNENQGSTYLYQIKCTILDPRELSDWPVHCDLLWDERVQAITYRELKAIYMKDKTPVTAYALVCPAMFVNDFDLLPELIAKIAENKPLKAQFDEFYAKRWKPHLDPDF
jgi:hypothetical protein